MLNCPHRGSLSTNNIKNIVNDNKKEKKRFTPLFLQYLHQV